jgi:hypothetical protein
MKKQLRFLYRYYIVMGRWRRLVNRQVLLIVVASLAFLITLGWTNPSSAGREHPRRPAEAAAQEYAAVALRQSTPQPAADGLVIPTPTNTPFPPEFIENADQTIGITLAGAVLVLIVVIGTLTLMPKKR